MIITINQISSQFTDWELFHCGDPRVDRKLIREAALEAQGLQRLYGAFPDTSETHLLGVVTVRTGQLQAPPEDVARVAGRTRVAVPTLHIEVLAVHADWHRQGIGEQLVASVKKIAGRTAARIGLVTLSLEATAESVAFYQAQGFLASDYVYEDGSRAMWFVL